MLPWLSDGIPVKGQSITDVDSFRKQVMSTAERHDGKILVAYASGAIKVYEMEEDTKPEALFKKIAPELARKAEKGKKGKKGRKSRRASEDDDEE